MGNPCVYTHRMEKVFEVDITSLAHDGSGVGEYEGQDVRVFGVFPGERANIRARRRKGLWVGTPVEILRADPSRVMPNEPGHFLSCSPWQSIRYEEEVRQKHGLLAKLYEYHGKSSLVRFHPAEAEYGYRTKMEFSFDDFAGPLAPAFFKRGGKGRVRAEEGCLLASPKMNEATKSVTHALREGGVSARSMKSLIIRESKETNDVLALLFVKDPGLPTPDLSGVGGLAGSMVFFSTEKSPASVATKELARSGKDSLVEQVLGRSFAYSWDSFFQNNVPMFERAVTRMRESIPAGSRIVELYSGVGTIGLLLAESAESVVGYETTPAAVLSARSNAAKNGIGNYAAHELLAEDIPGDIVKGADTLVLDPPRAGLHPKLIRTILEFPPERIAYLSCNPETQARDFSLLSGRYEIASIDGFDFYPRTPHLESLLVLVRKN